MKNPFKAAGDAVASTWHDAGHTDFWSPAMGRTMVTPVIPVIAVGSFVAALFQKAEPKK